MKMIEINSLTFKYNKKSDVIIDDLNVFFKRKTINVLLGLNGSGKTTLIKIITGLLDKYDGTVFIQNKNIKDISFKERAKILAYVPQINNQINDFSVKEYLLFGNVNRLKFYQSPTYEDEQNAILITRKLGIEYLLNKKMNEISGGERQIVSICGALIQNSEIIVLDEPTEALDIKNQYKVLSILKELVEKDNKTIILSSHNPNHALYLESMVYLLKKGKIINNGKAIDIITVNNLKTIYGHNIVNSDELSYKEISFR